MNKKAFTLVEILVVIVVIAILSSILISAIAGFMNKGQKAVAVKLMKEIETGLTKYYEANEEYPWYESGHNYYNYPILDLEITNAIKDYVDYPADYISATGVFLDPWERPFILVPHTMYDNLTNVTGSVTTGTSTTEIKANLSKEYEDVILGMTCTFDGGTENANQGRTISSYDTTTKVMKFTSAFTKKPKTGETFVINYVLPRANSAGDKYNGDTYQILSRGPTTGSTSDDITNF